MLLDENIFYFQALKHSIMAAFMIGKSLKDRRQTKAVEELFDKADKNGNGRISVSEYAQIFSDHGIQLSPEEVEKVIKAKLIYDRSIGTSEM